MTSSLSPISSAATDLRRRSDRLQSWLTQLIWLYGLFSILGLLGMGGAVVALLAVSGLPGADAPGGPLLVALVLASGLLVLVSLVLYVLAIRAAKRALAGAAEAGEGRVSPTLDQDVRRLNAWLTLGQWGTLVGAVLGLLFGVVTSQMAGALSSDAQVPSTFVLFGGLIGNLPTIVLTWLILASVKRFFSHVSLRARGSQQPVGPAAGAASGWLMFVYVFLWIAVGLSALSLLPALLLPAALGSERGADAAVGAGGLFALVAAFLALFGWLYSLLLRLVGHSRLFALEVAAQLDQPRTGEAAPLPDPWLNIPDPR